MTHYIKENFFKAPEYYYIGFVPELGLNNTKKHTCPVIKNKEYYTLVYKEPYFIKNYNEAGVYLEVIDNLFSTDNTFPYKTEYMTFSYPCYTNENPPPSTINQFNLDFLDNFESFKQVFFDHQINGYQSKSTSIGNSLLSLDAGNKSLGNKTYLAVFYDFLNKVLEAEAFELSPPNDPTKVLDPVTHTNNIKLLISKLMTSLFAEELLPILTAFNFNDTFKIFYTTQYKNGQKNLVTVELVVPYTRYQLDKTQNKYTSQNSFLSWAYEVKATLNSVRNTKTDLELMLLNNISKNALLCKSLVISKCVTGSGNINSPMPFRSSIRKVITRQKKQKKRSNFAVWEILIELQGPPSTYKKLFEFTGTEIEALSWCTFFNTFIQNTKTPEVNVTPTSTEQKVEFTNIENRIKVTKEYVALALSEFSKNTFLNLNELFHNGVPDDQTKDSLGTEIQNGTEQTQEPASSAGRA